MVELQGWPDDTIVVNVQGDEPLIPPALIRAVAEHLHNHPECAIATACHAIHDEASMRNPNIVKTVLDKDGNALYFSRAPIPWPRDAFAGTTAPARRLAGIAPYRHLRLPRQLPARIRQLPPIVLERYEALEQLRALYYGYKIGVFITEQAPPGGVDTEQDLHAARQTI